MEVLVDLNTGHTRIERDGFVWGTAESRVAWDAREASEVFPRPYTKPLALLRVPEIAAEQCQAMFEQAVDTAGLRPGDDITLTAAQWGARAVV